MVVSTFGISPQKKTGRVAFKSTPVSARARTVSEFRSNDTVRTKRKSPTAAGGVKRAAAGALASLSGPLAGSMGLGLVTGTDRDGFPQPIGASKAQATAARQAAPTPTPTPRPFRRAGAAAAAASAAAASAAANFAAKVPGAPIVGAISRSGSIASTLPLTVGKKSSLAKRKVGGGRNPDPTAKRRVKFSANVHTYPSVTNTKKSARIGELQLQRKVKKLKRNRLRREGGSGETATELLSSSGLAAPGSNPQDIFKHGTIVDVVPPTPAPPRVLRLNVVGKSSPATGKFALAQALLRKAKRTAAQEKAKRADTQETEGTPKTRSGKSKKRGGVKAGGGSTKALLGSSSRLVENSSGIAKRKKSAAAATTTTKTTATGIQRSRVAKPLHGRRVYGKA
ncbi:uncharacterized protein LOC108099425 [Drosophila ficusphila]|uniref:uncharacterized protein LOC108099425 n=1 Tax=Drosophila ficusphila TaxID=30025 RepID=UPI0007E6EA70|nr:uncharacterized protein LOC108099425 [Drosophila ficusphila]